jgi:cysteine desulfurase
VNPIYLDYGATTPLDPAVADVMAPWGVAGFGNPHSAHLWGYQAKAAVELARDSVAALIGAPPETIAFTSGATESVNWALKGLMTHPGQTRRRIVTVATEHSCVLETADYLASLGAQLTVLPVRSDGRLDSDDFARAMGDDVALVSVMLVNNELGVIQPIEELAKLTHEVGSIFMTDGTQAVGKLDFKVDEFDINLMAMSAHKFYGPKGVGALFVRQRRQKRIKLEALLHGGGHEGGRRSGTLNVAGIVGMGQAAALCQQKMKADAQKIGALRDELEKALLEIPNTAVNGNTVNRLYNITNIKFDGCDSDALIMGLQNIAVSNCSACSSASVEPSHVLMALGMTETEAFSCIRFSFGRFNSADEIPAVVAAVQKVVENLRAWN